MPQKRAKGVRLDNEIERRGSKIMVPPADWWLRPGSVATRDADHFWQKKAAQKEFSIRYLRPKHDE
jgi:hypothetical protein